MCIFVTSSYLAYFDHIHSQAPWPIIIVIIIFQISRQVVVVRQQYFSIPNLHFKMALLSSYLAWVGWALSVRLLQSLKVQHPPDPFESFHLSFFFRFNLFSLLFKNVPRSRPKNIVVMKINPVIAATSTVTSKKLIMA